MSYMPHQPVYIACNYRPNLVPVPESGLLPPQCFTFVQQTAQGVRQEFFPVTQHPSGPMYSAPSFQLQQQQQQFVFPSHVILHQPQYVAVSSTQILPESFLGTPNSFLVPPLPPYSYINHNQCTTPNFNNGLLPTPIIINHPPQSGYVATTTDNTHHQNNNWGNATQQYQSNQNRLKNGSRYPQTKCPPKVWSRSPRSHPQQQSQGEQTLNVNAQEFIPTFNANDRCSADSGLDDCGFTRIGAIDEFEEEDEVNDGEGKQLTIPMPKDTGNLTPEERKQLLLQTWDALAEMNKKAKSRKLKL